MGKYLSTRELAIQPTDQKFQSIRTLSPPDSKYPKNHLPRKVSHEAFGLCLGSHECMYVEKREIDR